MATIAENLIALNEEKLLQKRALEEQGQDMTGVPFTQYHEKIRAIQTGGEKDMLQARVDGDNSCKYLFYFYDGTEVDIKRLNTSNVTSMYYMFGNCAKLVGLDLSVLDTRNVASLENMFYRCTNLESVDVSNLDTSNVTTMNAMFRECENLTSIDLSGFNTSKVTKMNGMFQGCKKLKSLDLSNFIVDKVTDFGYMFSACREVESLILPKYKTSATTNSINMQYMFGSMNKLTILDLTNFDTRMSYVGNMFNGCKALQNIIGVLDVQTVNHMISTFAECHALESITLKNTSNSKEFEKTFYNCKALTTLGEIDMVSTTKTTNMLYGTYALTNLTLKNIKTSLTIGKSTTSTTTTYGTLLSEESLINTIKELWDLTGATSQTLTMSTPSKEKIANIYVKLVDVTGEMRAEDQYIDNKKPCVVCESTDEGAMTLTEYATSKNWAIA